MAPKDASVGYIISMFINYDFMNYLSHQKSFIVTKNFFSLFGYNGAKMAMKYLNKRPRTFLHLKIVPYSFPTLWYPQRRYAKYISDIFDAFITFNYVCPNEHLLETKFLPSISDFLLDKGIDEIYTILSFNSTSKNNLVGIIKPIDLVNKSICLSFSDNYFFSADFSWLFCITHENFLFFTGDRSFLQDFTAKFPDIKDYDTAREYLNKPV